ncbi:hypothetical protein [Leptospira andrefontaineae]|uniref:Uncharacterized protein n=1 Tax=Leptospira andrefontaineae TaxID=2484976 RepID=A0A4R9H6M8_9LEPT|nr:hypothetical protein [Leptospira andrefontaineae]TGK41256.1 hypothetical protein EHO65_07460 [Leptospira andrefontaineae]
MMINLMNLLCLGTRKYCRKIFIKASLQKKRIRLRRKTFKEMYLLLALSKVKILLSNKDWKQFEPNDFLTQIPLLAKYPLLKNATVVVKERFIEPVVRISSHDGTIVRSVYHGVVLYPIRINDTLVFEELEVDFRRFKQVLPPPPSNAYSHFRL